MSHDVDTREIGRSGIRASVVGLGTWAIGGWMWGGTDKAASIGAIRAAIDEGITLIDTAPAYGQGVSEEIVGHAIAGQRDKVIISTKCGLVWHTTEGRHFFDVDGRPVHRFLGPVSIEYELDQSLRRIGTDYIDHYVTHWQDPTTPVGETMDALLRLKDKGKIRSIGASNVSAEELEAYIATGGLDAIQEEFSMARRGIERKLLPMCRAAGVSVLSYSTLALGLLTGGIGPDRVFEGDDLRKGHPLFSPDSLARVARLMRTVRPIAESHGATPAQVVVAWTTAQPGITFSLCGARNPAQARENAAAGRIRLAQDELAAITAAVDSELSAIDG
jgi:methylglyoxal reductase